jgi:hypothetical protein
LYYLRSSAWTALPGIVDGTGALKNAAGGYTVTWTGPPTDWAQATINGVAAYYVRARISAGSYTTDPLITQGWVTLLGNHLVTALSLTSAAAWQDGGAVQDVAYAVGDRMELMIVTVAGAPTQIAVQVDFTMT